MNESAIGSTLVAAMSLVAISSASAAPRPRPARRQGRYTLAISPVMASWTAPGISHSL